ncbi:MAG: glycerate kinase [Kiritimatiellia bacterium]|nr:glycerate kinase [Kiritimatiellia bacterium]
MKVLIAPNSFKQCLSASRVGEAIAAGVRKACPDAEIKILPLSDGGDGLLDVCAGCFGGDYNEEDTLDPLSRPIKASWLKVGEMAVIEMAQASGLTRLKGPEEYNPLIASTFGTGVLISKALDRGCRQIVIGLGGSATVDAGCGLAAALGFDLLDKSARKIPSGGGNLCLLDKIVVACCDQRLRAAEIICLSDVRSPLLGPQGAARLFGPQKGATPFQVELLEKNLAHWAGVVKRNLGVDVTKIAGAGAAGGAGAGCAAFLGAIPRGGAEWVGNRIGLERAVAAADIIFTGEGRLDSQTGFGKIPAYVGRLAQKYGKHVIALGGAVEEEANLASVGITECRCINPPGISLPEAFRHAEKNLALTAERVMMQKSNRK